ncbi:MAG: archaeosortase/exosortase family protein [Candidatus Marinimicrobia bacterium]|nr:archaeosortase/exosortase family protein [Candidatus Neomarinimicrobiota bacterium]
MTSIKNRLTSSPALYFLIKVGTVCIVMQLAYDLFFLPSGRLDLFLCKSGAFLAAWCLNFLGWTTNSWGTILAVKGFGGVEIINDCNGLTLMGLYASFILAYTGPVKIKMLFISGGIFLIYLANVLRIMGFALANVYFPDHWDTFHEFSAFIFLYPLMLGLWYLWTVKSGQEDILSPSRFSLA